MSDSVLSPGASSYASVPRDSRTQLKTIGRRERFEIVVSRVRNTIWCLVIYIVMILLSTFLLVWELAGGPSHWTLVTVEGFIVAVLVLEVCIGIAIYKRDYFRSRGNILDFSLTVLALAFYFVSVEDTNPDDEEALSFVDSILIALRYIAQFSRLVLFVYRGHRTQTVLKQADIILHEEVVLSSLERHNHIEERFTMLGSSSRAESLSQSELRDDALLSSPGLRNMDFGHIEDDPGIGMPRHFSDHDRQAEELEADVELNHEVSGI